MFKNNISSGNVTKNYHNDVKLLLAFSLFLGDNKNKDIIKTKGQTNRFTILDYCEKICKNAKDIKNDKKYSKDKLTKSLQKSIVKKINFNNKFNETENIKVKMINDIKLILKKSLKTNNITLVKITNKLDNLIVPYIFSKYDYISYSTNDKTLFSKIPNSEKSHFNIVNINKAFKKSDNDIYYIQNLDNFNNLNEINLINNNFIFDLKSDYHDLHDVRVVSLSDYNIPEDDFNLFEISKLWSTLMYLNLDGIIN